MKPTHEMNLAEVTLAILRAAVNIPDGLYVHAARLAKRELATYGSDGNLVTPDLPLRLDEPDFKSDENALEIFSKLMAHKMAKSAAQGRSGWQQCSQEELSRMLREHVEKGDPVDVANFCMMLCANGFGIAAPAEDVRAMVDEPVAWYYAGTDVGNIVSLSRLDHYYRPCGLSGEHEYVKGVPLYRHPAPLCSEVAPQCSEQVRTQGQRKVVMPERQGVDHQDRFDNGWNACLDELERLNGDQS